MRTFGSACAVACASWFGVAHAEPALDVRGRVVDVDGAPVGGATVVVDGTGATAVTDRAGRFRVRAAAGALLIIEGGGSSVIAVAGPGALDIALPPVDAGETIEVIDDAPLAAAAAPAVAVTRDQIRVLPGARGDAIEAVRNLPGVAFATTGEGGGDLAIRGTSGSDSWYLLDGIAVPRATHMGGITAILPVELLGAVELHPGGFDVAHGRATGGIVELSTRPGRADRWQAAGELSFVHASLYAEGPVWKDKVTAIAGLRRSFLDAVLPAVLPDDTNLSFTQAPVYADAALRLDWYAAPRHRVVLLGLYSDDSFAIETDGEIENEPGVRRFAAGDDFWRLATTWSYDGERLDVRTIAAVGVDRETLDFGADHFLDTRAPTATGRSDLRFAIGGRATLRAGVDAQRSINDLDVRLPVGGGEGSPPSSLTLDPSVAMDSEVRDSVVAGYLAADLRPVPALTLTPGVRFERFGSIDDVVVMPRLAGALRFAEAWTARGSVGRFSRGHDQAESVAFHLRAETALQASLAVERRLGDGGRISATVFSSWLDDLAVFDPMLAPDDDALAGYTSRGTGTARGLELLAQVRRDDLFGWIAYTFSQSRRVDGPDQSERVFDQDQPHNLVAAGSWRRGAWRFGARFRLASGTPYTPVVGSVYVADYDVYRPVYDAINSRRLPGTHQLDLRVDRDFRRGRARMSAYLDVANVYANPRVAGFSYDFDYRERVEMTELPFLPSIGLRGEL